MAPVLRGSLVFDLDSLRLLPFFLRRRRFDVLSLSWVSYDRDPTFCIRFEFTFLCELHDLGVHVVQFQHLLLHLLVLLFHLVELR